MQKSFILLTLLFSACHIQAAACTLTANSIGGIKLGQTLSQVKRQFPKIKLAQTQDAEGAALTEIRLDKNTVIYAHIDENTKKIDFLETFSSACQTASGIAPNMPLRDVQTRLGKLKRITLTEIEMRQFAEFTHQPKWLTMRVDGGNFGTHDPDHFSLPMHTRQFQADAKIVSLAVAE